jgi:hypothetical protein
MARAFIQEPNTAPIAPHSCSCGSCGNGLPARARRFLVAADQFDPVVGGEIGVERVALAVLEGVEDVLESDDARSRAPRRIHL